MDGERHKLRRAECGVVERGPVRSGIGRFPDTAVVTVINDGCVVWGHGDRMNVGMKTRDAGTESRPAVRRISEDVGIDVAADIDLVRVCGIHSNRDIVKALAAGKSVYGRFVRPSRSAIGGLIERA